jgi:hypothetical protein
MDLEMDFALAADPSVRPGLYGYGADASGRRACPRAADFQESTGLSTSATRTNLVPTRTTKVHGSRTSRNIRLNWSTRYLKVSEQRKTLYVRTLQLAAFTLCAAYTEQYEPLDDKPVVHPEIYLRFVKFYL